MAYQNFYSSKITNAIGAADTSIVVDTAPTSTSGRMTLEARNSTQREIIKYTNVSGNTLTGVTRGQGGTTAKSHVAGSLIQQNLTGEDLQDIIDAFGTFAASTNDWRTLVGTLTSVSANGNRSYNMVFNTDLSSILSPGMRLRTTRTVAAPTQCTSLNGSTQYYSKSSPVGLSFTTTFTVGAWVKLTSYQTGGIIARRNGDTEGWSFRTEADGRVTCIGLRVASNNKNIASYQSLSLNKWVYVTATMDMSAGDTTAQKIWFDGVEVPRSYGISGTATALVQGTAALVVGANKSDGSEKFAGKIAQAFVASGQISDANIKALYSQGLTSALISSNNIISAYSFDNSINDLNTTNANNLTANGSAVATNADSPFGQQADGSISSTKDYGIIMKVGVSGGNTTVTVQVPEGNTIPTSGTITSIHYANVKAPYGMPVQRGKWRVECIIQTRLTGSFAATAQWTKLNNSSFQITIPTGSWMRGWQYSADLISNVSGVRQGATFFSDTTPTNGVYTYEGAAFQHEPSGTDGIGSPMREHKYEVSTATVNHFYAAILTSTGTESFAVLGDYTQSLVYADNAYL